MATRSTIGYETADGGYVGVYCHYDGYPENVGPILHAMLHADVVIMVSKALRGGGLRWVDADGEYETYNEEEPWGSEIVWPCCPDNYAYIKRLDGRVEFVSSDDMTPREWKR